MSEKKIETVLASPTMHWVGDGFPVSGVISPQTLRNRLSPFILMDYAGPTEFQPTDQPRGVDSHPHRGFETVTVVYQGELEHRDSAGHSGRIGPGDVQWMTAAGGVLHEEKHSAEFTRNGGVLEMAQLWVNLPARHKMSAPRYQELLRDAIPSASLPNDAGVVRIIAGPFNGSRAAANVFSPVILWDMHLRAGGGPVRLPLPDGYNAALFVRGGAIRSGGQRATARQLAILTVFGADVVVESDGPAELLVIGGEPINEPVAAYGPFVMNTAAEIQQAIVDTRAGRLGVLH